MKYGMGKMLCASFAVAAIPASLCALIMSSNTQEFISISTNSTILGGSAGFFCAALAHNAANQFGSLKKIGMSRGAQLAKKAQMATYAVGCSIGLLSAAFITENDSQHPVDNDVADQNSVEKNTAKLENFRLKRAYSYG